MDDPLDPTWDIRVLAPDPAGATAFVRRHRFEVGPPLSFDAEEGRITALEYVLGALGAEAAAGLRRACRRRRIPVDGVEVTVKGRLKSPLAYLRVVGVEGDPGLRAIRLRVYVTTGAGEEEVRAAWEESMAASPLLSTFRQAVELEISLKVVR